MHLVRFIAWLTAASLRRWRTFLVSGLLFALAGAWLASHLEIRTSFEELLPEDARSVKNAKELARRVGGDGTVLLMVEAERGPVELPHARRLATTLAEELGKLGPDVVRSIEAGVGPVRSWYADHWPMFLGVKDLRQARDALVEALGKGKAKVNPLLTLLDGTEDEGGASKRPALVRLVRDARRARDAHDGHPLPARDAEVAPLRALARTGGRGARGARDGASGRGGHGRRTGIAPPARLRPRRRIAATPHPVDGGTRAASNVRSVSPASPSLDRADAAR
jgi:hypothetical protein